MSALPILFSFRRCPYAMRARMALIIGEVQCELREVDLGDKPAQMLEVSPKGTVPVLLFADGSVLEESLDIMLWALSQSDVTAWLKPVDAHLDDMLDLIEQNDSEFKQHLDRYKYPDRYATEKADPLYHRTEACAFLCKLETLLNDNDFLFGPHASLADIAIFPFVRQFAATDPDWFAHLEHPRLQAWLTGWTESDLFSDAMHRYPIWQPDNPPAFLLPG
ncbi:MAG: glutathione S-transferase [Zetaproteobacteria bacterium CG12_big_fil_rev_8_21_14_0_65_55_1124]|nr:MAG: glutathione S-transferase [Zetaproteobacteria bacterium CG1_02_55_237]PIS19271.1 MAG: glutathione S-transferase [Zetaproteobacteria bacterium CG08_land_8_20_14_0_20_55_17]PIW43552.1 MAG: glutathione S-transferase [Zetaproteobacteria bacterium CG12_big_fil_rev_8_21_14_0_65_55_1124]PIY54394.1 MAG: glutathione S-transferase [Zetaproteobacteria bacterium CG_4_10_14_0_8_um_filter_55_43]PIZ39015.1 MAG: glutathione S-transferase [Zetaproteobacteria bacterium CG_4_10_14_0_2_um_filter_55_20]PJB